MSVSVRSAEPGDLPELLRLEAGSFSTDRLSRRSLKRLLQSPTALCLVAAGDGCLAGYALWLFRRNSVRVRLYSIAVDDRCQGQGIGRRLLTAGMEQALRRGGKRMSLEVRVDNGGALHLYRKMGFEEAGLRHGYYEDGADALCLLKTL